jgi:hypothetical protein
MNYIVEDSHFYGPYVLLQIFTKNTAIALCLYILYIRRILLRNGLLIRPGFVQRCHIEFTTQINHHKT